MTTGNLSCKQNQHSFSRQMSQMPQESLKSQAFFWSKVLLVRKVISHAKRYSLCSENWPNHNCEIKCEQELSGGCKMLKLAVREKRFWWLLLVMGQFHGDTNSDIILDYIYYIKLTISKHQAIKDPVYIKTAVRRASRTYFPWMTLTSVEDLTICIL